MHHYRGKWYFQCPECKGILMDPKHLPSPKQERERYLTHNNNPEQEGYQQFVMPIVEGITNDFTPNHRGLDFGAGESQIVTYMLTRRGYNIAPYDPLFHNDKDLLERTYHFIGCSEVIEHFHNPALEFERLFNLLEPDGKLYIKTDMYEADVDFSLWYYKDDPTHIFFYRLETMEWIKGKYGFKDLTVEGRLVVFTH